MKTEGSPNKVEFDPPKGFVLPEGAEPGKPWDAVCTFETNQETGKICMVKIADTDMPGYGSNEHEEKEKASPPSYDGMIGGLMDSRSEKG